MYVMEMNIIDIIGQKDSNDQKLLKMEHKNIGGFETLGEFFEQLEEMTKTNDPKAIRMYRFAQWLSDPSIFYSMINLLADLKSPIHAEYAMKSIVEIPDNPSDLCESIPEILGCVKNFQDAGVLYQAVYLFYRMNKVSDNIMSCLKNNRISVDEQVLKDVMIRMENISKYENDFHKNSDVRAEFSSVDTFIEFAKKFIDFK